MKILVFIGLLFGSSPMFAQDCGGRKKYSPDNAFSYSELFDDTAFLKVLAPTDSNFFYGFFHSNQSIFAIKYSSFTRYLSAHSKELTTQGKNWHLGEITAFRMNYEIAGLQRLMPAHSLDNGKSNPLIIYDFRDTVLLSVKLNFTWFEDSSAYGGKATGTVVLQGYYDADNMRMLDLDAWQKSMVVNGKWVAYANPASEGINLFWSAAKPVRNPDGSFSLTDLRVPQHIDPQNYTALIPVSNIVFPGNALKPGPNWFRIE